MWKQVAVLLLLVVVAAAAAGAGPSAYSHQGTSYQQTAYYPSHYHRYPYNADRLFTVGNFLRRNIDGWVQFGLKGVILLVIGYVTFSILASLSVLADDSGRDLAVVGLDGIDALERLQKAYDTFTGH